MPPDLGWSAPTSGEPGTRQACRAQRFASGAHRLSLVRGVSAQLGDEPVNVAGLSPPPVWPAPPPVPPNRTPTNSRSSGRTRDFSRRPLPDATSSHRRANPVRGRGHRREPRGGVCPENRDGRHTQHLDTLLRHHRLRELPGLAVTIRRQIHKMRLVVSTQHQYAAARVVRPKYDIRCLPSSFGGRVPGTAACWRRSTPAPPRDGLLQPGPTARYLTRCGRVRDGWHLFR